MGGVLELIHQQVLQAVIQLQGALGGLEFIAQRLDGAQGKLGEIYLALLGKDQPQVTHRVLQYREQGLDHGPLLIGILGVGQAGQPRQLTPQGLVFGPLSQNRRDLGLHLRLGRGLASGKALGLGDVLAPGALLREKHIRQRLPGRQAGRITAGHGGPVTEYRQRVICIQVGGRKTQAGQQQLSHGLIEARLQPHEVALNHPGQHLLGVLAAAVVQYVLQPLVAVRQHVGHQPGQAVDLVVQRPQQGGQGRGHLPAVFQLVHGLLGRSAIQEAGVVHHAGRLAQAG